MEKTASVRRDGCTLSDCVMNEWLTADVERAGRDITRAEPSRWSLPSALHPRPALTDATRPPTSTCRRPCFHVVVRRSPTGWKNSTTSSGSRSLEEATVYQLFGLSWNCEAGLPLIPWTNSDLSRNAKLFSFLLGRNRANTGSITKVFLSASVTQLVLDDVEIPTNCSEERREFWPTLLTERVAFAWVWRVLRGRSSRLVPPFGVLHAYRAMSLACLFVRWTSSRALEQF